MSPEVWGWELPDREVREPRRYELRSLIGAGLACLVIGGGAGWVAGAVTASQTMAPAGPAAPAETVTPQSPVQPAPRTTIADGVWVVGEDIQPGVWETRHTVGGDCYWQEARSASDPDVVRDDLPGAGTPKVTLREPGRVFVTQDCGKWVHVRG